MVKNFDRSLHSEWDSAKQGSTVESSNVGLRGFIEFSKVQKALTTRE